jgi:hypothetical protein
LNATNPFACRTPCYNSVITGDGDINVVIRKIGNSEGVIIPKEVAAGEIDEDGALRFLKDVTFALPG